MRWLKKQSQIGKDRSPYLGGLVSSWQKCFEKTKPMGRWAVYHACRSLAYFARAAAEAMAKFAVWVMLTLIWSICGCTISKRQIQSDI
jgi:hypothetical protein